MPPAAAPDDLAANLRLLCSFEPTIAEAARVLDLNRSQLNKYLAGSSQPRPALLRRIGDHFGVEVHEMLMPAEDFARLLAVRRSPSGGRHALLHSSLDRLLDEADPHGVELAGRYFEYYHSMSTPGHILRALIEFEVRDRVVYYRRIERITRPAGRCRRHYSYLGVALMLGDRIVLIDYESRLRIETTQTILYPDYTRPLSSLQGVKIGISANRMRLPCAARVLIERVPLHTGRLATLRRCGLFPVDGDEIPNRIRDAVDNRASGPSHFLAHPADGL